MEGFHLPSIFNERIKLGIKQKDYEAFGELFKAYNIPIYPCQDEIIKYYNKENSDFVLNDSIKNGGFGTVSKLTHKGFGFPVAVKQIAYSSQDLDMGITIRDEILTLKQLNHKNIVKCFGHYEDNKNFFIFLEYHEKSIKDRYEEKSFTETECMPIVKKLLKALKYLHSGNKIDNIIHRDLKGANILLNNKNKPILIDFGLSHKYSKVQNSKFLSRDVGTEGWQAPELLKVESECGSAVDIWGVGCVIIEMLKRGSPHGNQKADYNKPPPYPENISVNLKKFLDRCLQIIPSERATIDELLNHTWITNKDEDCNDNIYKNKDCNDIHKGEDCNDKIHKDEDYNNIYTYPKQRI
ncbi:hypothetical protein DICPUDRAFT_154589 [Dictyostelium purpureum]|uniref:Protein kinase domain-containing protein n=1 Tax=Dictyostelium purpureum TaxID=5786 RepID=F0ZRQ9_DICPU|nr:uncharacterized protein DICPUDRAFT_154589 [Dictyostelium purpureum]EGC33362.1 hypothetical protein DICPUDRAFT_154589 [Dictyostelium purpureum]|eukprot:XP_003290113.1 hypothetical protein DICPUDRAFT_154589 [Dictyostelium purpureum]